MFVGEGVAEGLNMFLVANVVQYNKCASTGAPGLLGNTAKSCEREREKTRID